MRHFIFWIFSVVMLVLCGVVLMVQHVLGCNRLGVTRHRRGRYIFK